MRDITVIGVPTSAGAHFPGLEQGPAHFRWAGLHERLAARGFAVRDVGDIPQVFCRLDPAEHGRQNLMAVVDVARGIAERVAEAWRPGAPLLVLGGDCSFSVGVVSGLLHRVESLGLLYFDGNVDLNTPETSTSGALDSMGVAHLLGLAGTALSRIGPRFPLLPDEALVLFGYHPDGLNPAEWPALESRAARSVPIDAVRADPSTADAAVAHLEQTCERFLVHFDIDALDFIGVSAANIPHYGGFTFDEAMTCLRRFLVSPACLGLVITEFNPDRDRYGTLAHRLIAALAEALTGAAAAA